MEYRTRITLDPARRGGRPCVRQTRITVDDILGWLAAGMMPQDIIADYPELDSNDVLACLAYAADREHHSQIVLAA
jgi:uncharacterized protein (DUF433 family)